MENVICGYFKYFSFKNYLQAIFMLEIKCFRTVYRVLLLMTYIKYLCTWKTRDATLNRVNFLLIFAS